MLNILVADDDMDARNGLSEVLKQKNSNINISALCKNGKEILQFVEEHPVDLIISDVKMPEMNGIQMCRELHKSGAYIPIILISAYAEFSYAQAAMEYGVRHYILKPMTYDKIDRICKIIDNIFEKKDRNVYPVDTEYNLPLKNEIKESLVEKVKNYINVNYTSPTLNTFSIASNFNITEPYLCRVFKQTEKRTVMEYILDRRIELAEKLLIDNSILIRDVAFRCGYENEKYFYKIFKKRIGVTPSQYRHASQRGGECV